MREKEGAGAAGKDTKGKRAVANAEEEGGLSLEERREWASRATSWMLPWEKAQMDGEKRPLMAWEIIYWAVFGVSVTLFGGNYLLDYLFPEVMVFKAEGQVQGKGGQGGKEEQQGESEAASTRR